MMSLQSITSFIGDMVIPRKHRKNISRYVEVAGIGWSAYMIFGVLVYVIAILSFTLSVLIVTTGQFASSALIIKIIWFVIFFPTLFLVLLALGRVIVKYAIDVRVYRKVREMEAVFPDFLSEVSLNLKSGKNMEGSLLLASKQDYGTLSEEMMRVATRAELGFDLQASIESFTESYPSDMISETLELVLISVRRGGQTPKLIDRLVNNMKIRSNLRDKVVASVANYRIFLATVTVLIAPAMMALAFHVINLIRSITTEVMQVTQQSMLPITVSAVRFDDTHFIVFSALVLLAVSTFSSLIVTYIRDGHVKNGSRQLFLYVLTSLASYAVCMLVFQQFFLIFQ